MVDVSQVEQRTDLVKSSSIGIEKPVGGMLTVSIADLAKVADLFSRSGVMVPPHCRDKPGVCFALCAQALEWRMPYLAVIGKSYVTSNRGVERIAYESQLLHAVVERNAPIKGRLRHEIVGEGDERRCKVWGTFRGETKPHEYLSETLAKLRDARGRNAEGKLKGSPLWEEQPDVQLFYSASRQWARLFCPDVILGAYAPEDPQWLEAEAEPVIPPILTRLRERQKHDGERGFNVDHVQRERTSIIEGEVNASPEGSEPHADTEGRGDRDADRTDGDQDQAGRAGPRGGDQASGEPAAGDQEAGAGQAGEGGETGPRPKAKGKRA